MCADEVVDNEEVADKQNVDEVVDNEEAADKQNAEELVEKTLDEDEVIDNEEVSTNENEEVIMEEIGVEKIIVDDEDKETILFMWTWLMEHGGYKQEDTQEWGLDKLKEEMNKVEIEMAMYENKSLEQEKKGKKDDKRLKKGSSPRSIAVRRKWRHKMFDANVGYTWASLNRMGDERLLNELDNLKKLVGECFERKQEATDPENVDKDVDTLLTSVAFVQT
ncbi:hypothetical protein L1987_78436 [Smallanthus sonchifolius]|uniref:Uncharacterized protein n=1 Tax=Smallanthus sonchifolius TaxID=185202 RepID=A0ACB8ZDP7_9ASTR|nr:hypothetical protein L1987_78436 [Smallanthus sonchifolius]